MMKLNLFSRDSFSPIGLDVGTRSIKAVQVRHTKAGPVIARAASIPRAPDAASCPSSSEAERVMSALWRLDFQANRIVLAIPREHLLGAVMELPPRTSGAPLSVIARQELARSSKANAAALEMVWWELPGGARASEGTHVMALGCRHSDAEALMDAFEMGGAEVVAIDAATLATVRALAPLLAPDPEVTAIADLSWSSSELIIVQGDTIVYERSIKELGLAALVSVLKAKLSIDEDAAMYTLRHVGCVRATEGQLDHAHANRARAIICAHIDAVTEELRMSIGYAGRRFGTTQASALLTGGLATLPGAVQRMIAHAETPLRHARVADLYTVDDHCQRACDDAAMLTALGLALHNAPTNLRVIQEVHA